MTQKFSIYFHLFNAIENSFQYKEAIDNFLSFADEVVCATMPSRDETLEELKKIAAAHSNFKLVETNINITDNRFDGKLKTAALEKTTHPIKIIADADERFVLSGKDQWQYYATLLLQQRYDGFLIPVVDLWGDELKIRRSKDIGQKFRMHKGTIVSRGVIPQAELGNGLFDPTISDNTEPLNQNGQLGLFGSIIDSFQLKAENAWMLGKTIPYVLHYGYLDFQKRVDLNKAFWDDKWKSYSGKKQNVTTDIETLKAEKTITHRLVLV